MPRRLVGCCRRTREIRRRVGRYGRSRRLALLIVFCSLVKMDERFGGSPPDAALAVDGWIEPLHIVSSYGLFAVMTTERDEIVFEGSYDGVELARV